MAPNLVFAVKYRIYPFYVWECFGYFNTEILAQRVLDLFFTNMDHIIGGIDLEIEPFEVKIMKKTLPPTNEPIYVLDDGFPDGKITPIIVKYDLKFWTDHLLYISQTVQKKIDDQEIVNKQKMGDFTNRLQQIAATKP